MNTSPALVNIGEALHELLMQTTALHQFAPAQITNWPQLMLLTRRVIHITLSQLASLRVDPQGVPYRPPRIDAADDYFSHGNERAFTGFVEPTMAQKAESAAAAANAAAAAAAGAAAGDAPAAAAADQQPAGDDAHAADADADAADAGDAAAADGDVAAGDDDAGADDVADVADGGDTENEPPQDVADAAPER